jgi:VanZ family protein
MNRFLRVLCVSLWLAVLAWAGTIFYLSSLEGHSVEELNIFHLWDKAAHFVAYAAGGVLLAAAFRIAFRWRPAVIFRRTLLVLALYAASDEWHQMYTPGRSGADLRDWIADVLGTAAGAALVVARRPKPAALPLAKGCESA